MEGEKVPLEMAPKAKARVRRGHTAAPSCSPGRHGRRPWGNPEACSTGSHGHPLESGGGVQFQGHTPGGSDGGSNHHHRGRLLRSKGGSRWTGEESRGREWRPSSSCPGDRDHLGGDPETSDRHAYDALQDTPLPAWMLPSGDGGPLPACSQGEKEKSVRRAELGRQPGRCKGSRPGGRRAASAAGQGRRTWPGQATRGRRACSQTPGSRRAADGSWRRDEQEEEEEKEGQEGSRLFG